MTRLRTLLNLGRDGHLKPSAIPECLPFSIDPPGAKEAFLLLHGFTGNPAEMLTLGKALADAGYAVHAPRYPGHGTNRKDFYASGAADWLRRAYDARLELGARYETVHVAGHSMGGVIASAVASSFKTPRLVLLAPAFRLTIPGAWITPWVAPFRGSRKIDRSPSAENSHDPVRRLLHEEYWKDDLIRPTAELVRIAHRVRGNLRRVEAKTLALFGTQDPTVPLSTGELLRKSLTRAESLELTHLEGAGHLFPFDDRSGETAEAILRWLRGE